MDHDQLDNIKVHELASDLLLGNAFAGVISQRGQLERSNVKSGGPWVDEPWAPLYSSKEFARNHAEISVEPFKLNQRIQRGLGVHIS